MSCPGKSSGYAFNVWSDGFPLWTLQLVSVDDSSVKIKYKKLSTFLPNYRNLSGMMQMNRKVNPRVDSFH